MHKHTVCQVIHKTKDEIYINKSVEGKRLYFLSASFVSFTSSAS